MFFHAVLGFTPQTIKYFNVAYKSDEMVSLTTIYKFLLKGDCINGSIVNGTRKPILYNFGLGLSPGHRKT